MGNVNETLDLSKPLRLMGSQIVRKYGGEVNGGHVLLCADGSFATGAPVAMEHIEAQYENVVEETSKPPQPPPTAAVTITTRVARCAEKESRGRYSLCNFLLAPSDGEHAWVIATNGKQLAIARQHGEVNCIQQMPSALARVKDLPMSVKREGDKWLTQDGRYAQHCGEGLFPKIQGVLPKCEGRMAYRLDAVCLRDLASAIIEDGEDQFITLLLSPTDHEVPIAVVAESGIGVLMPGGFDDRYENWRSKQCSEFDRIAGEVKTALCNGVTESQLAARTAGEGSDERGN